LPSEWISQIQFVGVEPLKILETYFPYLHLNHLCAANQSNRLVLNSNPNFSTSNTFPQGKQHLKALPRDQIVTTFIDLTIVTCSPEACSA
jgi:hypothetical protein